MGRSNRLFPVRILINFITGVFLTTNAWVLYRFLGWIREFEHAGSVPCDLSSYLAVQAHAHSLLQVYLVVFSLGLAVIAIWGLNAIKQAAEQSAEKKAEEVAKYIANQVATSVAEDVAAKIARSVAEEASNKVLKEYVEGLKTHQKLMEEIKNNYTINSMPEKEVFSEMREDKSQHQEETSDNNYQCDATD